MLRIAAAIVFILGGAAGMAAITVPEIDSGPLNTTYFIEGQPILLKHGKQERPAAPGSATRATFYYLARGYTELNRETHVAANGSDNVVIKMSKRLTI